MKKCKIFWKEGGPRLFHVFTAKDVDDMSCVDAAVEGIIIGEALEHEFVRHGGEIDHIECDGKIVDLESIRFEELKSLDRLTDKTYRCLEKIPFIK